MYPLLILALSCIPQCSVLHTCTIEETHYKYAQHSSELASIQVIMEFETEKKGHKIDKESGEYPMVFGGSRYAFMTENSDSKAHLIMDMDARVVTTISKDKNGDVAAVKMPLMKLGRGLSKELVQTIQETSEKKTILGYETRRFIITSNGSITEAWIAKIDGLDWGKLSEAMLKGGNLKMSSNVPFIQDMPNALTLESHTTMKGGKKIIHSFVRLLAIGEEADLSALDVPSNAKVQDLTSIMKF